jgi:hypothetical protein
MAAFACLTGFPGKVGVAGSDVEGLWHSGESGKTAVRDYNLGDIVSQAAILLRVLMCRGDISMDEYRAAGRALLEHVNADPRLVALRNVINRQRFLMESEIP